MGHSFREHQPKVFMEPVRNVTAAEAEEEQFFCADTAGWRPKRGFAFSPSSPGCGAPFLGPSR